MPFSWRRLQDNPVNIEMPEPNSKYPEKLSDRFEIRVHQSVKDRFLVACKRAGETPSDVLRAAMAEYIDAVELAERKTLRQELSMKFIHNPLKAAGMALTSLAAFALVAAPSSADEVLFKALDENEDGALTQQDAAIGEEVILALDQDHSKTVTLEEFKTHAVYGYISLTDPGFEDPEGWSSWSEERQTAYSAERTAKVKVIEETLISLDLSQIGEIHIIKKPIPTSGSITPFPFGDDFEKVIVEFVPEGAEISP